MKTVFVGMSGGVDSSVSAALLKEQGYNVVGVFIKTWHPEFIACSEEEERRDAMRVCAHLNIPFLTFDFEEVYKKQVADYMISEYKIGRTPNPDVMCNKEVKFGAFYNKAISMGADYVATGHYAQTGKISFHFELPEGPAPVIRGRAQGRKMRRNVTCLYKSVDPTKDQVYFLWTLKQEQLSKILFPIGHLNKKDVRILAKKYKIPVAEKKDSQGICFLGAVDLKDFLKHYISTKNGKVVLAESVKERNKKSDVIGHHDGVMFFTIGERHGFTINKKGPNDMPYYVVAKDIKKNILYVSQDKNINMKQKSLINLGAFALGRNKKLEPKGIDASNSSNFSISINNLNYISNIPEIGKDYTAQIRYHGEFLPCKIIKLNKDTAEIVFEKYFLVDNGQSCVLYDKNIVLGGGIINLNTL